MHLLYCIILSLSLFYSFSARAEEEFSVNIRADVVDENSSAAQQKAMSNASKAAIMDVVKRISNQEGIEKISSMNDNQLINFIKETSVSDEKTSDNRYIADLRVVVNVD